jgi:hypothetical protein
MTNLAGKPPMGQKQPKPANKPRKPIPKQSAKRKAYMDSQARADGLAHMERVAQLPCLVCGAWPVEVHHATKPRNDMEVLPLCARHHRREYGPGAIHYSPKAFAALHGSASSLLARVAAMLSN